MSAPHETSAVALFLSEREHRVLVDLVLHEAPKGEFSREEVEAVVKKITTPYSVEDVDLPRILR